MASWHCARLFIVTSLCSGVGLRRAVISSYSNRDSKRWNVVKMIGTKEPTKTPKFSHLCIRHDVHPRQRWARAVKKSLSVLGPKLHHECHIIFRPVRPIDSACRSAVNRDLWRRGEFNNRVGSISVVLPAPIPPRRAAVAAAVVIVVFVVIVPYPKARSVMRSDPCDETVPICLPYLTQMEHHIIEGTLRLPSTIAASGMSVKRD